MERIWTTELVQHIGEHVRLAGWLHRLRTFGGLSFLILRDGSGTAQIVVSEDDLIQRLSALPAESVLAVEGLVISSEQAPSGLEVQAHHIEALVEASAPPPFDLFRPIIQAQLPTLLDHAPVALRHPQLRRNFQLSAAALNGFRHALNKLKFVEITTPKIVASATEGGANVFRLDYFERSAYLAQSPQFYKQIMVGVFERVYEVGPVFRAEPHDTPRHLNEYVSLDAELGFIDDHSTVMSVLTDVLAGMIGSVRDLAAQDRGFQDIEIPISPTSIPTIHFTEALEMIGRATGEDLANELDLAPAHEKWLGDWAKREHGADFLFVTGFPMAKRPFYTHSDPARPSYSNSFDLLFRGLEVVTGGQRLHRYDDYLAALTARNLDTEPFTWYLEAFKHGMPPHGGFAIGLERWIARLIGAANVRTTTLFPRDRQRVMP
jgi:nondiscriminating aspartyl-tRNA synthetase